jgi:hypothetical protein
MNTCAQKRKTSRGRDSYRETWTGGAQENLAGKLIPRGEQTRALDRPRGTVSQLASSLAEQALGLVGWKLAQLAMRTTEKSTDASNERPADGKQQSKKNPCKHSEN